MRDLASSLRLSLYTEVARALKGSEEESICSASAKRLFLSRVAHSWSHSSLRNQTPRFNFKIGEVAAISLLICAYKNNPMIINRPDSQLIVAFSHKINPPTSGKPQQRHTLKIF